MRRTLIALVLACGLGLPLVTFSTVSADDAAVGPVAFTVHAAICPIDVVNDPNIGLYDGCHANGIEGVTFTFSSLETEPVSFTTGAGGVGTGEILAGLSSATQVTLTSDDPSRGYAYCSDQNSGTVLFDGIKWEESAVPLFTVTADQAIVCDWYIYIDAAEAVG
jgi:hypothetical protein